MKREMGVKTVTKVRVLIVIVAYLNCLNGFSQKIKTQYFLIDKKDTLITRLTCSNCGYGDSGSYRLINERKMVKRYVRSDELDGDDIEVNDFESYRFAPINKDNDTIVDESYLKRFNIIKTREEFFKVNADFDETKNEFVFIEPLKCGKFIVREVRPVIFE